MSNKSNTIPHSPLIQSSISRLEPLFVILFHSQHDTELEQKQSSGL